MITRDQVMPILLAACPSFEEPWRQHSSEPDYDGSLLYIDLAVFARHLVTLQVAGETSEFGRVFDAVERLHLDGDDYVREAATIGLLEGIQNIAGNQGIDPKCFLPDLEPETAT